MSNWQDILKTQESVTDNNVSIFKPKQGFTLESDNNCCEKFKNKVMDWLERWVIPEYGGHWIDEDCETVYEALERFILPHAKSNNDGEGHKLITGNSNNYQQYKNNRYWEIEHPQLKQAQKEIEDIKEQWDKECKKDKEYSNKGSNWWGVEE